MAWLTDDCVLPRARAARENPCCCATAKNACKRALSSGADPAVRDGRRGEGVIVKND
jgi:hypothetical protein